MLFRSGCAPLHSSKFDPDERAIAVGIKVITESIVKLNNENLILLANEN